MPSPSNVPLLRPLWSLLDGIWGVFGGTLGGAGGLWLFDYGLVTVFMSS